MRRLVVAIVLAAAALGAPAAGAQGLSEGLAGAAEKVANFLSREANRPGVQRLRVTFRPAFTVILEERVFCRALSNGLRDTLRERVSALRRDRGARFETVAADERRHSPPDVTMSWAWDPPALRLTIRVLAEGDRLESVSAELKADDLSARERACLFDFRIGEREVTAEASGRLRAEPSLASRSRVGRYAKGDKLFVLGTLTAADGSGTVWSLVEWEDDREIRHVFTTGLPAAAPDPVTAAIPDPAVVEDGAAPLEAGDTFRDCAECPEMVVLPSGSFSMGSPSSEEGRWDNEGPVHRVRIGYRLAVGKYEVTFAEWDACLDAGGCGHDPDDAGWGRGSRPVMRVSWEDAQEYVAWLNVRLGLSGSGAYRLLSESEWEYAARAGTRTARYWGSGVGRNNANCDGCGSRWDNRQTAPVGSFGANGWGLHDMLGNVWEWTQDCWNGNYAGAPSDGRAWGTGDCSLRDLRGGSWDFGPRYLRAANRGGYDSGNRDYDNGFRVARTLTP